jgi:GrpB-like predicted nucleotidyltransferase (UPF0157 family)
LPPRPERALIARHPSLDDRFDPAVRSVAYDPGWPIEAAQELERIAAALGPLATRLLPTPR